ncbi:MAG: hypothetical protein SGI77_21025 [Pirellulaceae bacterium]|nr:hypothetical protein [Pirellulaceae bacterium]
MVSSLNTSPLTSSIINYSEKLGSEFRVNQHPTGRQFNSSIAILADSNFVITWQSDGQDGSSSGVYARRYGIPAYHGINNPLSNEFRVNVNTLGAQGSPSVSAFAEGFEIGWDNGSQVGTVRDIYARRYNNSGAPMDAIEFTVNSNLENEQSQPAIVAAPDGAFIMTWQTNASDQIGFGIKAQRFGPTGVRIGGEIRVNSTDENDQTVPSIALYKSGNFVNAWQSLGQDGSGQGIFAQRFHSSGQPIEDEFQVNSSVVSNQYFPAVSAKVESNFIVTWMDDGNAKDIFARQFDTAPLTIVQSTLSNEKLRHKVGFSELTPINGASSVNNVENWSLQRDGTDVAITGATQTSRKEVLLNFAAALEPGDYELIAKGTITDLAGRQLDGNTDGEPGDDYVERFTISAEPVPLGATKIISSVPSDADVKEGLAVNPIDQSYIVVWQGPAAVPGETDIYARRFDAQGSPLGVQVRVNTSTVDDQTSPTIAMDSSGNYVIVWDTSVSGVNHYVAAQRFQANGTRVGPEFQLQIAPSFVVTQPTLAMNSTGAFVISWQHKPTSSPSILAQEIYTQQFAANGTVMGSPIRVDNPSFAYPHSNPDVAIDAAGNVIVTWEEPREPNSFRPNQYVKARRISALGVPGNELSVDNTFPLIYLYQSKPRIAMNPAGDTVITWQNNGSIVARRFDGQLSAIGFSFELTYPDNSTFPGIWREVPDVAIDNDGNFVVICSNGSDQPLQSDGYSARWFDKWGNL